MKKLIILSICAFTLAACAPEPKEETKTVSSYAKRPLINPPIKGVDIPNASFIVKAELGDTLFYESGSIIVFPENSFLDENGNIAKGEVEVEYREFSNPTDFFISGIPMDYDSAGVNYQFESTGMCELNAFQKGNQLFVNPQAKPQVKMISSSMNKNHNLYVLDTNQRNWVCKGKPRVDSVDMVEKEVIISVKKDNEPDLVKPVPPAKPSGEQPVFDVTIEPGSVKELSVYNNLTFELIAEENGFKRKDAEELWEDINVIPSDKEGVYVVSFSNSNRTVTYKARPVFDGEDYELALTLFKKREKKYKELLAQRLKREESIKKKNEQIRKENERIRAKNKEIQELKKLIIARNKKIKEENDKVKQEMKKRIAEKQKEKEKRAEERRKRAEELNRLYSQDRFKEGGVSTYSDIYRSFSIDGFGVWNSDNPLAYQKKPKVLLHASFKDEKGEALNFKMVNSIFSDFNGIVCNHKHTPEFTYLDFAVIPNSKNKIWAVKDNKLYYLTEEDFSKCDINEGTEEYTFILKKADREINTIVDVRDVLLN